MTMAITRKAERGSTMCNWDSRTRRRQARTWRSGQPRLALLRVLAGFEQADGGTITIGTAVADGPVIHLAPERRRIGYVPQEGSLFPHLTVEANIGFGLARRDRRGLRTAELLDAAGLAGLARRYPDRKST